MIICCGISKYKHSVYCDCEGIKYVYSIKINDCFHEIIIFFTSFFLNHIHMQNTRAKEF